jgi:hypothetical protein
MMINELKGIKNIHCYRRVRLAYQSPVNNTFLSEQIIHQQPTSNTFLSAPATNHQSNEHAHNIFI